MSQSLATNQSHKCISCSDLKYSHCPIWQRKKMKGIFESSVIVIHWICAQMPLHTVWSADDIQYINRIVRELKPFEDQNRRNQWTLSWILWPVGKPIFNCQTFCYQLKGSSKLRLSTTMQVIRKAVLKKYRLDFF